MYFESVNGLTEIYGKLLDKKNAFLQSGFIFMHDC